MLMEQMYDLRTTRIQKKTASNGVTRNDVSWSTAQNTFTNHMKMRKETLLSKHFQHKKFSIE